MDYKVTAAGAPFLELWQEKTVYVLSGGFNLTGLAAFAALGYVQKGLPISLDFAARTATVIRGAVLTADLLIAGTTAQVKKGHNFQVGDFIGTAAAAQNITAIDKTNVAYDVITLNAAIGAVSTGGVLLQATATGASKILKVNALVYADVKYNERAMPVSAIVQAYEVRNGRLPYPLTVTQQTELSSRFIFVP